MKIYKRNRTALNVQSCLNQNTLILSNEINTIDYQVPHVFGMLLN